MEGLSFLWAMGVPALLCLLLGLGLVIYEIFTPGFAFPGLTGLVLLIASVILTVHSLAEALMMIMLILVVLTVVFIIALRSATKGNLAKSALVLKDRSTREDGYLSTEDMQFFVGKDGRAATVLRPAGMADFDGVKLDVVTEGEFVEKDAPVTVIRVEGRRIVVRSQK